MSEKRTFIRIPTRVRGLARILEHDDVPIFQGAASEAAGVPTKTPPKNVPEPLWEFLTEINSKLDTLISLLNQNRLKEDFPINLLVTELSGAGLQFRTKSEVRTGDIMEVALVLSEFPLSMAGAVGRVVRSGSGPDLALEFTKMRDRDTEAIVQFVFKEQREQIRGDKWS